MAPGMQAQGPIDRDNPRFRHFEEPTQYKGQPFVKVPVSEDSDEEVLIDPEHGPVVWRPDGSRTYTKAYYSGDKTPQVKSWRGMSVTEQTILLHTVAKRNRSLKALHSTA
mmetsp:Transcript_84600/g.196712  ORF Transcript_84600/g.196712 Transcript_84600/m.196712 type:complete len:110 (-) Transcript_84600:119-448(-)|eukprot:CAMPEP_0171096164 /NCGR_PEP_ID=MMETSP0766_2-20121228/43745_1 /TAXON_ID=439317 /ORGANISM="Gambierdiscus australes, Strain CAWD 149" /LENGTH=109 /DNA_ID=CAMNT_0011555081 /DNA_START=43 /DNA_END=372 /DNA_ORIENTATION=+